MPQLGDGTQIGPPHLLEQHAPQGRSVGAGDHRGGEIDHEWLSFRAPQDVPVVQISMGNAPGMDRLEEPVEPIEERPVHIPGMQRVEAAARDVLQREGLAIRAPDEPGNPRDPGKQSVGALFPVELPGAEQIANGPGTARRILDHERVLARIDQIDFGLGHVASPAQGAAGQACDALPVQGGNDGRYGRISPHGNAVNIAQEKGLTTAVEVAATPEVTVTIIKRRGWAKADIKKLSLNGLQAILKDFADKNLFVRWLGRLQMRREIRALTRLSGLDGTPSYFGRLAPCGIMLEVMKGQPINQWRSERPADIAAVFRRLAALVAAMHRRGVAHLDLRKYDNILVAVDGTPSIIDFNASVCVTPGGLAARLFFPLFRAIDRAALLKWKSQLCPAAMTGDEIRLHRRMTRLRRFWIFN